MKRKGKLEIDKQGNRTRVLDIGCSDFEAAAESRWRQKHGTYDEWWNWYYNVLRHTPRNRRLPQGMPLGDLPNVGKQARRTTGNDD